MRTKTERYPDGAAIRSRQGKTKRYSKNREQVLACVKSTKCHPTAEWVYGQLKEQSPDLSLGTVYRNLRELQAAGEICSVGTVDGKERFDGFTEPHLHGVCERCGGVVDIPAETWSAEIMKEAEAAGFAASSVQLRLFGVCAACQRGEKNGSCDE